jgi:hypothetical protein
MLEGWGSRRQAAILGGVVLLAVGTVPWSGAFRREAGDASSPSAQPAASAGPSGVMLQKELELASGGGFYLVVDPATSRLRLMLSAVELASYPILAAELGRPQVAFVERPAPEWTEPRIWEGGVLAPERERERREIVVAVGSEKTGTEPAPTIPPLPEEGEAPPRFSLVYPDLLVEIVSADAGASLGGFGAWLSERFSVLRRGPEPTRLRVTLAAADAASLYRSLPPDTRLLIPALAAPAVAATSTEEAGSSSQAQAKGADPR